MSSGFLQAIVDVILPAESRPPEGELPIPGGCAVGVDLARYPLATPILGALRQAAGGEAAFLASDVGQRRAALEAVERARPEDFRALLEALLADYYETPAVIQAFGWRAEPPQPRGHVLSPDDEGTAGGLERVRHRRGLWRRANPIS